MIFRKIIIVNGGASHFFYFHKIFFKKGAMLLSGYERKNMLTKIEETKYIKSIPPEVNGEERRAAYAVIAGYRDDKSPAQIASYYAINQEIVDRWFEFFDFKNSTSTDGKKKRGRKNKDISSYINSKIGDIVTPKSVAEELEISLPTFYNFYNSNRHLFKKVKRGEFEILNPKISKSENK